MKRRAVLKTLGLGVPAAAMALFTGAAQVDFNRRERPPQRSITMPPQGTGAYIRNMGMAFDGGVKNPRVLYYYWTPEGEIIMPDGFVMGDRGRIVGDTL